MAIVDVEKTGDMKNGENSQPLKRNEALSSVKSSENLWTPWLIPLIVLVNVVLFIAVICRNVRQHNDKHSWSTPSKSTLINMGALEPLKIVDEHQGWRLFTSMWLHKNVIYATVNMVSTLLVGICLERQFGFVRIGLIYILSGFGGSIYTLLYGESSLSICSSAPVCGLMGALLAQLLINSTRYQHEIPPLVIYLAILVVSLFVALGKNPTQLGGLLTGYVLGFLLLLRHQSGWTDRQHTPANSPVKSKYNTFQVLLWVVALIFFTFGFVESLVKLFKKLHQPGTGN